LGGAGLEARLTLTLAFGAAWDADGVSVTTPGIFPGLAAFLRMGDFLPEEDLAIVRQ
jgi:hypothetical protein